MDGLLALRCGNYATGLAQEPMTLQQQDEGLVAGVNERAAAAVPRDWERAP
jgi:hypothetical protein